MTTTNTTDITSMTDADLDAFLARKRYAVGSTVQVSIGYGEYVTGRVIERTGKVYAVEVPSRTGSTVYEVGARDLRA